MTHKEALTIRNALLEPDTCEGELELTDIFRDNDPIDLEREISIYRCQLCDARLSMVGCYCLNAYRIPAPGPTSAVLVRKPEEE